MLTFVLLLIDLHVKFLLVNKSRYLQLLVFWLQLYHVLLDPINKGSWFTTGD